VWIDSFRRFTLWLLVQPLSPAQVAATAAALTSPVALRIRNRIGIRLRCLRDSLWSEDMHNPAQCQCVLLYLQVPFLILQQLQCGVQQFVSARSCSCCRRSCGCCCCGGGGCFCSSIFSWAFVCAPFLGLC